MSIVPKQCISKFTEASRGLRCYCTPLVLKLPQKDSQKEWLKIVKDPALVAPPHTAGAAVAETASDVV